MHYIFIVLFVILILTSWALLVTISRSKITNINIKMTKAENNIGDLLKQKYELMNKCYQIIKKNIHKKDYFKDFSELKIDKLSDHDLDEELEKHFDIMREIRDAYKSLKTEEYSSLIIKIDEINENIYANKIFFNKYNDVLIKELKGINKIVATFLKIKVRTSYEIKEPKID